jgi:hypothetical protein
VNKRMQMHGIACMCIRMYACTRKYTDCFHGCKGLWTVSGLVLKVFGSWSGLGVALCSRCLALGGGVGWGGGGCGCPCA